MIATWQSQKREGRHDTWEEYIQVEQYGVGLFAYFTFYIFLFL